MKSHALTPLNKGEVAVALPEGAPSARDSVIGHFTARFMPALRALNAAQKSGPAFRFTLLLWALMLVATAFPHLAHATDLLKTQQQDASDTFGLQSSVMRWIYFAEIIISVVGFIKTRNPLVFVGLIIVLLVTRAFYGMIG